MGVGKRKIHIDIEASRPANGRRQQMLLVEVKCFPDPENTTRELYTALGQYLIYRTILHDRGIAAALYLAVPAAVFETIFDTIVRRVTTAYAIKLLVVDLDAEVITQWIET